MKVMQLIGQPVADMVPLGPVPPPSREGAVEVTVAGSEETGVGLDMVIVVLSLDLGGRSVQKGLTKVECLVVNVLPQEESSGGVVRREEAFFHLFITATDMERLSVLSDAELPFEDEESAP